MPSYSPTIALQLTGFYLFRRYVPQVSNPSQNRQNRKALSWVLSLFSSIVLFTGTFTLSSEIEWSLPGSGGGHNKSVGQGSSLLVASMHRFPHESGLATSYCAYFVSYLICDLALGMVYYRDFVDPLSGWAHHLFYLGVMSRATAQGNISTFFAMGTPIEVSTIFLAAGHIFPTLRSDVIFATSFFLARIVYPVALLPELYLNVEARICWKVGAMALLVHVYWFRKFIQQQTRYFHARQAQKQTGLTLSADVKEEKAQLVAVSEKEKVKEEVKSGEMLKKAGIVYEYEVTVPVAKAVDDSDDMKAPESPRSDEVSGLDQQLAAFDQIQVNSSRHRRPRVVRLPSGQFISSLTAYESPVDKESTSLTVAPPAITITPTTPIPMTTTTATTSTATSASRAKTMKQLLEECSDEDISMYRFPLNNNKTLSGLAMRRPTNGSQGIAGNDINGIVRLSRASSMRDSKRRIALGAVQFASQPEPREREMKEVKEERKKEKERKKKGVDMDATVVMRPRRTSPSRDGDYGFGTIRASRGGGVVAVNA
ncbi:hypothetical protein BGX23_001322 [Mortierella sp. AD031]|nr:hypothetical protein BGX23_001322 [Mortierella sp. AD031]